jgi:DNA-binding NarL/FixJ family response regulator
MPEDTKKQVLRTLIAARAGVVQEALRATLSTSPWVEIIGSAGEVPAMLDLVAARQPALLVLDHRLVAEDELVGLVRQLKERQATLQCLVLVETDSQGYQFLAAGARAVLLRDDPTERWQETLAGLAGRNHNENQQ